jgi:hypothetical protein
MDYYSLLATRSLVFEKEPIEEILRERMNFYNSNNKSIDFWILNSFDEVKNQVYEEELKILNMLGNYVIVVSTDKNFIDWLHLRFPNSRKFHRHRGRTIETTIIH